MSLKPSLRGAALCAALLGSTALLLGAPAAQAGLADQMVSCDSYTFEQPFLRWEEPLLLDYVLAPNGGFERRAQDWQLSDRARVVRGNEKYYVHGRADSHSLWLPAGSTATSRAMCAGVEYPTLRLFARNRGGATAILNVEMLYEVNNQLRSVQLLPLLGVNPTTGLPVRDTAVTAGRQWEPTLPLVLPVALKVLLGTISDEPTAIAFRFTSPQGGGDWYIDDTYVDPYRHY
jgi:hypothetical protein